VIDGTPNVAIAASTLRRVHSASRNDWSAVCRTRAGFHAGPDLRDLEILDRIESNIATQEQLQEYLEILFERVETTQYPSRDLLDRLERLSHLA